MNSIVRGKSSAFISLHEEEGCWGVRKSKTEEGNSIGYCKHENNTLNPPGGQSEQQYQANPDGVIPDL